MPLTLDDVLFNRKPEPYTMRNLYNYLDEKCATELIDFWISAQDLRNMFEPEHARSSYSMNRWQLPEGEVVDDDALLAPRSLTPSLREKAESLAKTKEEMKKRHTEAQIMMRSTYIDDDSALCINISDDMRLRIIRDCPKDSEAEPKPGLFDEAMNECERLIELNYFRIFKDLADEHAQRRALMPRAAPPPAPAPKPRASRVLKGHILTKEEIAALVPKEPPPPELQ
jgi:hypothetical protein